MSEAPDIGPYLPDLGRRATLYLREAEASRSKVGGATEVYLLFAIQLAFKRAFYTISGASSMMARKRLVWRHFIVDFTNTVFAKCQLCQKSIS